MVLSLLYPVRRPSIVLLLLLQADPGCPLRVTHDEVYGFLFLLVYLVDVVDGGKRTDLYALELQV